MLVVEDILKSMKKHFPRWMDIRRKYSSSGSLLLESVAEEVSDIQSAIEEYKKDFFIDKYINNEDDILTFLYKTNIGSTDVESVILINPDLEIVDDQNKFFELENVVYYADGILYFKENYKEIQYAIDKYVSTASLEKMHVWNIFDEFATFVGLKRYQWETNKELLNRILNKANRTINSTEDGLKEALIVNLTNIAPELKKEDIIIERPTPENLVKYYDEFETILDHLCGINRDVYKDKKWDIDTWNFAIKSVDYIPHVWDIALKSYANGIGDNDDLKVSVIDANAKTDAVISFYQKNQSSINAYIKNHNIKEEFELNLKKYENMLKPETVKYRITASEIEEISPSNITFDLCEEKTGHFNALLEDIADEFLYGILVEDNAELDDYFKYRLRFIPTGEETDFKILKCKQVDGDTYKNLIEEKSGFQFIDDTREGVTCGKVIKHVVDNYQYNNVDNAIKTVDGFQIDNISNEAEFKLNINGCANEILHCKYSFKEVPMLFSYVNTNNCYVDQDTIISDTVDGDKYIEINGEMNSISMTIEGPYSMSYSVGNNGYKTKYDYSNKKTEFKIDGHNTPQVMKIKINLLEPNCKISNLMYSKFTFNMHTEKGDFEYSQKGSYLPSYDLNNLYVTMRSFTGVSPTLEYIHIGTHLNENDYYGYIDFDPCDGGNKLETRFEGCRLELTKIDRYDGSVVEVIDDYKPYKMYSAIESNAQVELLLDDYHDIKNISAKDCEIETISYGENYVQCLLKIPANVSISEIQISGSTKKVIKNLGLNNVLTKKGFIPNNYTFGVAKNIDKIIAVDKNGSMEYIDIRKRDLFSDVNIKTIKVNYYDADNIIAKFIEIDAESNDNKSITVSNDFDGDFDILTFIPTHGSIYKAINSYDVILTEHYFVEVANTFTKGYDMKKSMFYIVESLNEDYRVCFSDSETIYSIDYLEVTIKKIDSDKLNYNYETIVVKKELPLNSRVELPNSVILENNEQIDIDRYIITNYENIVYKTRLDDPENAEDYCKTESIYVSSSGFNKLKYSNIDEVVSISMKYGDSGYAIEEGVDYRILKKEGIILWLGDNPGDPIVTIKYYIKKAAYIEFDINDLYEKVKYNVNSLSLINKVQLEKISTNDLIDLNLYESYKKSDLTTIQCSQPGFTASIQNDILKFTKNLENNTVAVRTGFYYMDGSEYYMFADDNFDNIEKIDDIYLNNVLKENKKFILRQQTTNFVTNSCLALKTLGDIFNLNCKDENISGTSKLNAITACDSYNYWKTVGSNLSITKGLNGQGISISSMRNINGYSYVPLSKFLSEEDIYVVSFYMAGQDAEAYIGKERLMHSVNSTFNKESIIDIYEKIMPSEIEDNIYEIEISHKKDDSYYLIIKNNALIDDVIITNKSKFEFGMHKKNIDHLGLNIEENIYAEYNTRIYLTEEDGAKFDGTEIGPDDEIVNTSYIHWGFTSIKEINSFLDFNKCVLSNINLDQYNNKCIAKTESQKGTILTNAIFIGNTKIVKNLVYKINNVMFDNMKGFKISVLTANSLDESFRVVSKHSDNIGCISGDNLSSYVKLMVEMPSNKVINNIELFIEYSSNEVDTPADLSVLSGTYTSKVFDVQYNERFLIKNINVSDYNKTLSNYVFEIRAAKENDENTVWTDWKTINTKIVDNELIISNRIVFDNYRYFQFRLTLKGEDAYIKANYIDLEVI